VTGGVGVLALGGGVVTGLLQLDKDAAAREGCLQSGGRTVCPESSQALFDEAESLALVTNLLLISGGVLAATGATLYLTGSAEEPQSPAVALSPLPLPTGGGLAAVGRF